MAEGKVMVTPKEAPSSNAGKSGSAVPQVLLSAGQQITVPKVGPAAAVKSVDSERELLLDSLTLEQGSQAADEARHPGHHTSPGVAARILAMALACSSHCRVSRLSRARPCVVRW